MKRQAAAILLLAFCLLPASAMASSFSWNFPGSSGSYSSDGSTSATTNGTLTVDATTVNWDLTFGTGGAISGSGSALVDGQNYSGSFDFADLFSLLFF